ncbi:MAG TPA: hypothetical protein VIN36_03505 [Thiobacillus sp.]
MAFTELLAVGSGAASSADITVGNGVYRATRAVSSPAVGVTYTLDGARATFVLKGTNGVIPLGAMVKITAKGDDGLYYTVQPGGVLHEGNRSLSIDVA